MFDWVPHHQSAAFLSVAAFLVVAAAAAEVEGLGPFFPLVVLDREPRLRLPWLLLAPVAAFLGVAAPLAAGFFAEVLRVAAFVHAATAFVSAAVLSNHLSCGEGLAVGPTCALKSSISEKRPAVETSD